MILKVPDLVATDHHGIEILDCLLKLRRSETGWGVGQMFMLECLVFENVPGRLGQLPGAVADLVERDSCADAPAPPPPQRCVLYGIVVDDNGLMPQSGQGLRQCPRLQGAAEIIS